MSAKRDFPRNEKWDYFVECMKYVDVWYSVLDNDVGEILDYMYEIMNWAKENDVWGEDNFKAIVEAKEDWK